MADEKRAEEPAVPGGEAQQEARRGWLLDVGLYAAGHYSGAFTMSQYVHANPDDLAAGRDALSAIYRMGEPS